ncbi:MAG TPA: DUF4345 domain-containing protein [Acidimicrobiales bacterium]|nr:DUF4345 domain-containing protein [Acidimicrobiales bacterium]
MTAATHQATVVEPFRTAAWEAVEPGHVSRRLLQAYLFVLGTVATVFGLQGVLAGVRGVRDSTRGVDFGERGARNVDSELRFFAAWYALAGALLLRAAPRPEAATATVRGTSVALWLAAFGRVLSLRAAGRPHRTYVVLLGIEIVIPLVALPWQARVARALR